MFQSIIRKQEMMLMQGQKGQSLIEVLVALAILGVVAVAFLTALTTGSTAIIIADERTTAESLARSELEYIKNSDYDADNNPPQYTEDPSLSYPADYSISIEAIRLDPYGDGTDNDDGIQKITVKVYHNATPNPEDLILITSTYKVNR